MKPDVPWHSGGPSQGPTQTDVRIAAPTKDYLTNAQLSRQEFPPSRPRPVPQHAVHGSCQELVLARFDYNARVVRRAASSSLSSEKAPRTRSVSEWWMVARLSVMIIDRKSV